MIKIMHNTKSIRHTLLMAVACFTLSGCFTSYMMHTSMNTIVNVPAIEDEALGIAQLPDAATEPGPTLVIYGKHYAYQVTSGGDTLVSLMTQMDPAYTAIEKDRGISLYLNEEHTGFSGDTSVFFTKPARRLTDAERQFLTDNKFAYREGNHFQFIREHYIRTISIKGRVIAKPENMVITKTFAKPYKFKLTRPQKQGISPELAFILPMNVLMDVLTSPVQAVFAGTVAATAPDAPATPAATDTERKDAP